LGCAYREVLHRCLSEAKEPSLISTQHFLDPLLELWSDLDNCSCRWLAQPFAPLSLNNLKQALHRTIIAS
jgi:hypothetical protein